MFNIHRTLQISFLQKLRNKEVEKAMVTKVYQKNRGLVGGCFSWKLFHHWIQNNLVLALPLSYDIEDNVLVLNSNAYYVHFG